MKWKRILLTTWIVACCAISVACQDLSKLSRPEDSGFSTERTGALCANSFMGL